MIDVQAVIVITYQPNKNHRTVGNWYVLCKTYVYLQTYNYKYILHNMMYTYYKSHS